MTQPHSPSSSHAAGYALGSFATGVYSTIPTVLLLYYCTEVLGFAPSAAAIIVLIPKVWVIAWDPAVGFWSDRTNSPSGRRSPFMLAGTLGVALSFVLLFNPPEAANSFLFLYVFAAYFFMTTTYSVFAVPYIAVPAEVGGDPHVRERLLAWRMTFAMCGVLAGAGLAPYLTSWGGGGRAGYTFMAIVIAMTCAGAMIVSCVAVRRFAVPAPRKPLTVPVREGLRTLLANRSYVRVWAAYLLQLSGAALVTSLTPYFVVQIFHRSERDVGTALGALVIGTILAIPLWSQLMKRLNPWRALALACVLYAVSAAALGLLAPTISFTQALLGYFWLGVPFAGLQLLPFVLLAHLTHADASRGGIPQEGLYTGVWTAGEKIGLALGPAIAGACLSLSGYVSGAARQADETLGTLTMLIAFGPAVLLLASLLLIWPQLRDPVHPAQALESTP